MIKLKIKEAQECLEHIEQLASTQARDYVIKLSAEHQKVDALEEDKRLLNARVNDLVISSDKHEKENARILIAGLVIGAIVGATGAILWMGLS